MKTLENYIAYTAGVHDLKSMTWKQIVDQVVLPKMAGKEHRRYINDKFMQLMAQYHYDMMLKDRELLTVLQQIALQRISRGAVPHISIEFKPLPHEYRVYSSVFDKEHLMTQGCYNFIMSGAMELAVKDPATREHTLEIMFGLIRHISPQGKVEWPYIMPEEFKAKGLELYGRATGFVEKNAKFEEIFEHYAQPSQWKNHRVWFAEYYKRIDWDLFFKKTCTLQGNFVKRYFTKREIQRELYRLSLPVVSI